MDHAATRRAAQVTPDPSVERRARDANVRGGLGHRVQRLLEQKTIARARQCNLPLVAVCDGSGSTVHRGYDSDPSLTAR